MRKFALILLAGACAANAATIASTPLAVTIPAASVVKTTATTKVSANSSFSIADNAVLNVELLDNCWNNRENLDKQQMIADYLMTLPKVPNDFETAWKTARLVYFIGNYGVGEKRFVNTSDGITLFDYGAQAGLLASKLNPKAVEGFYWYAVDLGSWGLAKGIIASASHAKDGMNALDKANHIDPSYQWYGSNRILGRYYEELPGLFGGNSDKALAFINAAVKSAPEFRGNWLYLGQYYSSAGQYDKALDACNKAVSASSLDGKYEEMRYFKEAKQCVLKAKSNQR